MKYQKQFVEEFRGKIFSTRDVKLFLKDKNANPNYVSLFLSNNVKNKKIFCLKKGIYSFDNNLDNVEKAFFPSYHGLQDALSIHELWGQQTIPILITPKKIRTGERKVLNSKIIIRKISRKMFFGFIEKKYFGSWITVSDVEKTLIDLVYYNEPIDIKIIKKIKAQINMLKLNDYLKQTSKLVQKKVRLILN
jgi:predicted transcriptional regulator of viral defense system